MGEEQVREARKLLEDAGIPAFRMPETAIELFHHISKYYRNQKLLLQTPEPTRQQAAPRPKAQDADRGRCSRERRKVLSEMESKAILRAFRFRSPRPWSPARATEALLLAEQIGFPIAMKIDSPRSTHKTDAGGVRLNINAAPPCATPITTSSTR